MTDNTAKVFDLNDSERELRELRAKREKIAQERERRQAEVDTAQALEDEKIALANEEALAQAEIEIGPLGRKIDTVETPLGIVILKRAHPAVFKRFQDRGKVGTKEQYELVRPSLVYPELAAFERICEELPATLLRCADAVAGLAGVRADELAKKL